MLCRRSPSAVLGLPGGLRGGISRRFLCFFKDIQGAGGHGRKTADDVTDVFSNDYIFTVCEEEAFLRIQTDITNFIKEYGGKCIVSDAMLLI